MVGPKRSETARKRPHSVRILEWKSRFCPVNWQNGSRADIVRRHHRNDNAVGGAIREGVRSVGIVKWEPHTLRHSFAAPCVGGRV